VAEQVSSMTAEAIWPWMVDSVEWIIALVQGTVILSWHSWQVGHQLWLYIFCCPWGP